MAFREILDPAKIGSEPNEVACQAPLFVVAMLQNVYLDHDRTSPPIGHKGDFWHWILTDYGLALMRALVRASGNSFSYSETFMAARIDAFPQLVLLEALNIVIQKQLAHLAPPPDWAHIFEHSQFLHNRDISINTPVFQREIEHLIEQITQGRYDQSGSRVYTSPGSARLEWRNANE